MAAAAHKMAAVDPVVLLVFLVAALIPCCAGSFRVEQTGISQITVPPFSHLEIMEQVWTVFPAASNLNTGLTSILSSLPCQVYVSYVPRNTPTSDTVATIRAIGDSKSVIHHNVVVAVDPNQQQLQLVQSLGDTNVDGYVRVEVVLHERALLHRIQSTGSGQLVIDDFVFVETTTGNVTIELSGSGHVYLPPQLRLAVDTLQIKATGSGTVTVMGSELSLHVLEVALSGSGAVDIGARQLRATEGVFLKSYSSGSLTVSSGDWQTPRVDIEAVGSGATTLEGGGSATAVDDCTMHVAGSGSTDAGSLVCANAVVVASGSGEVTVQVKSSLTYSKFGSGTIFYVGHTPDKVVNKMGGLSSKGIVQVADSQPSESSPLWAESFTLPPRQMTHLSEHSDTWDSMEPGDPWMFPTDDGGDGDDPKEEEDAKAERRRDDHEHDRGSSSANAKTTASTTSPAETEVGPLKTTIHTSTIFILLGVALIVWRISSCCRRRGRGAEKSPLLSKEAPVYI